MKISLITEFFPIGKDLKFSGGVEARTYFIAKNLAKKHTVSVICSRQPRTKAFEKMSGINVHRVGPEYSYNPGTNGVLELPLKIKFIVSAIKCGTNLQPDIVDGGNFIAHLIAKQIAQKIKIPVVFWYPDVFINQWFKMLGLFSGTAGYLLEKINLTRKADHYIAISSHTQTKLIKNGISNKKISVIPCGIDPNEFKIDDKKKKVMTICCISRLVRYKRVEDLIWAFAVFLKNNEGKLVIVGRGPQEKRLKNIIQMLKIARHVSFASNLGRKELIKTLKSSHLFCLPSETEGFGIVVIEAAASGVPYVISDIDVLKEITEMGKGGILFETGNVDDLASKIEKILGDFSLYKQKIKEGKKLSQKYHWSEIAHKTEKVYQLLLNYSP